MSFGLQVLQFGGLCKTSTFQKGDSYAMRSVIRQLRSTIADVWMACDLGMLRRTRRDTFSIPEHHCSRATLDMAASNFPNFPMKDQDNFHGSSTTNQL
jgi:hypothetical protein